MTIARITVHPAFAIGPIDRRIFGSFVEHMGRCVYTGIYEPEHSTADADGFRGDVAELTRELGTTIVRYPGGNFVSNYRWEDGVGPRDERPKRIDLAWRSLETNHVGTDDFVRWTALTGTEPMIAINLGTRGPAEAADLVEYCNIAGGTTLSEQRRANGSDAPHGIRLWCLGNEMDGPWQIGHRSADEYGRLASQTAQAMRRVDPTIELVACGSSARDIATFGEWERVVLEHTFDDVDYISVHAYFQERDGDRASFLASGASFEAFLHEVIATADSVAAKRHSSKRIRLSVDEWNVWYMDRFVGETNLELTEKPRLIEDVYSTLDAVVVGDLLTTLVRNADRVGVACLAQLVNVIAPIMTEPGGEAWRQTTFFPIALLSQHAQGAALDARLDSPRLATMKYGEVDALSAAVVHNAEAGELVLAVTNRSSDIVTTSLEHDGFGVLELIEALTVRADDAGPRRTADEVADGAPRPFDGVTVGDRKTTMSLPAQSWSLVRLRLLS